MCIKSVLLVHLLKVLFSTVIESVLNAKCVLKLNKPAAKSIRLFKYL